MGVNKESIIRDVKEMLRIKKKWIIHVFRICPSYLILKDGNIPLEDEKRIQDYNLEEGSEITMNLNVTLVDKSGNGPKTLYKEIPYDCRVEDLIREIGNSGTSLNLTNNKPCLPKKFVRNYLRKENGTFNIIRNTQHRLGVESPVGDVSPSSNNAMKESSNIIKTLPKQSYVEENVNKETEVDNTNNKQLPSETELTIKHEPLASVESPENESESSNITKQIIIQNSNKRRTKKTLNISRILEKNEDIDTFKIEVDSKCTIEELLGIISRKIEIPLCNMKVFHSDKLLIKGSIEEYNIEENDNLILKSVKFNEQFVIKLQNTASTLEESKAQRFLVEEIQTVKSLKMILREQYNVNINCIKLFFKEQELKDESIVRQLDIDNGATLMFHMDKVVEEKDQEIKVKVRRCLTNESSSECKDISINAISKVEDLKLEIDKRFDKLPEDYVITFSGEILKNDNKLSIYNIKGGDEVIISHSLLIRYFMTGDNYSAKVFRYAFLPGETVLDLKAKITKKLNFDAKAIILTFDANTLENDTILEEAGIENGSYVMMVATLAGGF